MRTSVLTFGNLQLGQPHIVHQPSGAQSAKPKESDAAAPLMARLYWESFKGATIARATDLTVGVSIFPRDTTRGRRAWAERYLSRIVHWNKLDRGGHFAAWEQPELFVQEVATCFRSVR
jgi:pimeloyl-ACP methyl ester carboxylesterase